MLFQRLSYKLDLINTMVAQSYGLPETLYADISDSGLVGVCEVRQIKNPFNNIPAFPASDIFIDVLRRCAAWRHTSPPSASVSLPSCASATASSTSAWATCSLRLRLWSVDSICTSTPSAGRSSGSWSVEVMFRSASLCCFLFLRCG